MSEITGNRPHGTPNWVDIGVPDLPRAREFYRALFGWDYVEGPEETGYYTMCLVRGKRAAAIGSTMDQDSTAFWWNVYFATEDVDGAAKRIADAGGSVVTEPMDVMDQGRMAIAKDPDGAHFGLWQGRAHTGAEIVDEPGTMCWHELTTADTAASASFYAAVLERPVEPMGLPEFDYYTVKVGEDSVAGLWGVPGQTTRWTPYFAVSDADEAVQRATEGGGKVLRPAQDSPYGRFAVIADPFGAELAVMRPSEEG